MVDVKRGHFTSGSPQPRSACPEDPQKHPMLACRFKP
jgi:hypothetical protein